MTSSTYIHTSGIEYVHHLYLYHTFVCLPDPSRTLIRRFLSPYLFGRTPSHTFAANTNSSGFKIIKIIKNYPTFARLRAVAYRSLQSRADRRRRYRRSGDSGDGDESPWSGRWNPITSDVYNNGKLKILE